MKRKLAQYIVFPAYGWAPGPVYGWGMLKIPVKFKRN
jgi:hypothetical protein